MTDCAFCLASLVLLVLVYKAFDWLLRLFYVGHYGDRYILITGCDTGFGNLAAKRLDALGCHVMAGCLTEAGETELTKSCSTRMRPVHMDVSKPDSVRGALDKVKTLLPPGKGLWGVLNNAGIAIAMGPPEWLTLDDYKNTAAVNLYGLIDVTMTFLPLVKMTRGRIVNTSSMAGRLSVAHNVAYCVTKYGVEAFTDGLRRSLYPFGVKALIIEPGGHKTNFATRNSLEAAIRKSWSQATPEVKAEYSEEYLQNYLTNVLSALLKFASGDPSHVVDAYVHALLGRFPRARYAVGMDAKAVIFFLTLPEWMSDWAINKLMDKVMGKVPLPAALKKTS